jgi:hypothetical protein
MSKNINDTKMTYDETLKNLSFVKTKLIITKLLCPQKSNLIMWGEGFFFSFFPDPNVFALCSFKVPNGFPSDFQYVSQVPNVFPNMFSVTPHFYPIGFIADVIILLSPIIWWVKGEELYTSQ